MGHDKYTMTTFEWIEVAKERIEDNVIIDYRFNNVQDIKDIIIYLNKAQEEIRLMALTHK